VVPPQERAEFTRQRIISAGVELFETDGYATTDMSDVVIRASVSSPPFGITVHRNGSGATSISPAAAAAFSLLKSLTVFSA
jgi:hypothetical protein